MTSNLSDKMDPASLQEFDPLAQSSETVAKQQDQDINIGNGVTLWNNNEQNSEKQNATAEVAVDALDLFDDFFGAPTQGQNSTLSGQSKFYASQTKNPNLAPLRPARPPPPPPTKRRSVSDNTLFELDPKFVNLNFSAGSTRSLKSNSSFYLDSDTDNVKVTELTTRPTRSASSFYVESTTDMSSKATLRNSGSNSSFFVDPSARDGMNVAITSQPLPRSTSSFRSEISGGDVSRIDAEKLLGRREQIMQLCMAKRQDEYTVLKPHRIFCGTWNVNGQIPPYDVKDWLSSEEFERDPPDIYFIGFQELDLSKEAYVFSDSSREDEWITVVSRSLPSAKVKYSLLKCIRLVGMMLLVYVKTMHVLSIKDVSWHQVGTGLLGRMGNKGGVSVRLDLHNSSICAVNSHLAAHLEQCNRRNEDFHDICTRLKFPIEGQLPVSLHHHDVVFWLGDLNYRIQELSSEFVKDEINAKRYKALKEHDQLLIEKSQGRVFSGFQEGEVDFRPTYKYNPGTDEWDTSEKCRTPAWCDRVLWWEHALNQTNLTKVKPKSGVNLLKYQQHMTLNISDHKPVSALFDVNVKVIDEGRYKKVFEDENRNLDRLENEYLPSIVLDGHQVDFGEVKFQQPKLETLEIKNDGMIPCNFEFISRPEQPSFCKKWLTIAKHKGILMPKESCILEFEVYVNRITAPLLNSGEEKLEDILILHLHGGKDFFITVNGRYLPSCFGTSIETLCRLAKPIRDIPPEVIQRLSKIQPTRELGNSERPTTLEIPKELWTLVDHIYTFAKKQEDLFQQPGLHSEVEDIRDCLDSTLDPGNERQRLPGSNHSAAEALLILLEAFPEPVIPFHLYHQCLEVCDILHTCKQVLQGMSKHHRNVFKYLTAFLRELLQYGEENGLNKNLVANLFSGLMLRPNQKMRKQGIEGRLNRERASRFLMHFLLNPYDE